MNTLLEEIKQLFSGFGFGYSENGDESDWVFTIDEVEVSPQISYNDYLFTLLFNLPSFKEVAETFTPENFNKINKLFPILRYRWSNDNKTFMLEITCSQLKEIK